MELRTSFAGGERYRAIRRVLLLVLVLDLTMAAGKGLYGHLTGSLGMSADGLHSAMHASAGVVGLVGVYLASRPPDPEHPYGYERYERPVGDTGEGLDASVDSRDAGGHRSQLCHYVWRDRSHPRHRCMGEKA